MQKEEDLRGDNLKHYEAEIEAMNLILISIPNDIYNSVDACSTAKAMWQRVKRLMRRTLMNDLERNGIIFPKVTINTKFLNCLQPEWLKYITQVCLAKRLTLDSYDDLFDYLQQFEKLINASRAKKLKKSHDPLALVAHTGSSSRTTTPYYVTHPSSVVDYDDDYQGDAVQNNSEDPLTSAMILLARAITQRFFNLTNNRLRTSSNTRNQASVQEVTEYMWIFDELDTEYERCVLANKNLKIERKNLLIQNDCLIANCLEKDICSIVLASDIVVPLEPPVESSFTAKINALTAENAKLKTELSGKKSSGSTASEKPKVLASWMYTNSSKYVLPPPKRANWVKPTLLPKKKQVTFQEPPRTSNRPTHKPPVQQNKKPNVATESRKPMPKSHTRNHRILPSKSVNARKAADHNRKLNDELVLVKH
ncbi:hypothetical protein Tco_0803687 [Tanacetum coccineum]|uniref:Uncharacterized protein n=1 Tax=Tanacetum coccineum TaxID=301880 RepID=A0ABQ5A2C6_9ASTR